MRSMEGVVSRPGETYEWEIDPTMRGAQRFTGCGGPESYPATPTDLTSTRLRMTSACQTKWSNATCVSKTKWRLQSVVAPGCALLSINPEPRYAEIEKWSKSPHKVVSSGVDRTRRALYIDTEIRGFSKTPSPISKTNGERQAKTNT